MSEEIVGLFGTQHEVVAGKNVAMIPIGLALLVFWYSSIAAELSRGTFKLTTTL